ncbi:type II methionyl aminopeptidase [Candidatus Woesearchaeota archaeon]|nr:type II methionyl aminopeptidase [Candidatus Woesearchaeota archaeon]
MENEILESWKKAGKIAAEAREYGKTLIKPESNFLEVSRKIEEFIVKKGAKPGFPVQLSINGIAAHYTAFPEDNSVFSEGNLVKLDLGAHINGYIGDTALTLEVSTNKNQELIKASKEALDAAIKLAKPGTKVCEIGEAVDNVITKYGFHPIKNLSGHKIDQYILHSNLSIPNYNNKDKTELEEDMIIAIEPFASTGMGLIKEGKASSNYRLYEFKPVRDSITKEILLFIKKEFSTLPFAKRYLVPKFPLAKVNYALSNLEKLGIIYQYPQLPEKEENCLVSQHEHTIYIKDKPIILTKVDD